MDGYANCKADLLDTLLFSSWWQVNKYKKTLHNESRSTGLMLEQWSLDIIGKRDSVRELKADEVISLRAFRQAFLQNTGD